MISSHSSIINTTKEMGGDFNDQRGPVRDINGYTEYDYGLLVGDRRHRETQEGISKLKQEVSNARRAAVGALVLALVIGVINRESLSTNFIPSLISLGNGIGAFAEALLKAEEEGEIATTSTGGSTSGNGSSAPGGTISTGGLICAPAFSPVEPADPLTQEIVMTNGLEGHAAGFEAIDIAVGQKGKGANPTDSDAAHIIAPMDGVYDVGSIQLGTWPAGNYMRLKRHPECPVDENNPDFAVAFSHWDVLDPGFEQMVEQAKAEGRNQVIVRAGTRLASIGKTGNSSGPHLDYGVWKNGALVNPLDHNGMKPGPWANQSLRRNDKSRFVRQGVWG
jgi:hypothetical protein